LLFEFVLFVSIVLPVFPLTCRYVNRHLHK